MNRLAIKSLGVGVLCALTVVGCTDPKDKEKAKQGETPEVTQISNLSCDDASIKNGLLQTLTNKVESHIADGLDDFKGAKDLDLETLVKKRLPDIAVDLQNVRNENGVCLTDLHITLPMADVGYANRHFKKQGEPSVGERADAAGITFNDNAFVSAISYRIDGGEVKLDNSPEVLALVADASSAAAYAIAKDGQDKPKPAPKVSSGDSRQAAPAPTATVKPRPKPTENNAAPAKPKASSEQKPRAEREERDTPRVENRNETRNDTRNENRPEPKSEPKTEAKAEPKERSEPKAAPKAEPKSEPKESVKDTSSEITITETDDTY